MSYVHPFCRSAARAVSAVAALLLLASAAIVPLRAQVVPAGQHAALSEGRQIRRCQIRSRKIRDVKAGRASPAAAAAANSEVVGATDQAASPQQKSITGRAIDKVKQVAKSAGDIFNRVPCLPPKGGSKKMGSLPHVATKLASGQPVLIIAFGSSSTAGYGSTSPEFTYPNRLAAQLHRQYPTADITVVNRGQGGEDAPEMMKRLQTEVIDMHPDLVIWQVGTNAVLRNLDPAETARMVEDGVARIQAAGADLVLVDPAIFAARSTRRRRVPARW